mmetsp:Transcript_75106/g.179283  ORF Transcript_75106/g.179283 Transcript_75106/m.179283 type:complete len:510 (-) Transcript_75106:3692-5221(-)
MEKLSCLGIEDDEVLPELVIRDVEERKAVEAWGEEIPFALRRSSALDGAGQAEEAPGGERVVLGLEVRGDLVEGGLQALRRPATAGAPHQRAVHELVLRPAEAFCSPRDGQQPLIFHELLADAIDADLLPFSAQAGIHADVEGLRLAELRLDGCGHALVAHEPCWAQALRPGRTAAAALVAAGARDRQPHATVRTDPALQANGAVPLAGPGIERTCRTCDGLGVGGIRPTHVAFWAHDSCVARSRAIAPQRTSAGAVGGAAGRRAEEALVAGLRRGEVPRLGVLRLGALEAMQPRRAWPRLFPGEVKRTAGHTGGHALLTKVAPGTALVGNHQAWLITDPAPAAGDGLDHPGSRAPKANGTQLALHLPGVGHEAPRRTRGWHTHARALAEVPHRARHDAEGEIVESLVLAEVADRAFAKKAEGQGGAGPVAVVQRHPQSGMPQRLAGSRCQHIWHLAHDLGRGDEHHRGRAYPLEGAVQPGRVQEPVAKDRHEAAAVGHANLRIHIAEQ